MGQVTLTIDGTAVTVDSNKTILEAALENGIYIPHLCYYPDLSSVGVCRLCVVDIRGRRPAIACKTPVEPGLVVTTETPEIAAIRKVAVELLIVNHDADCLACPKDSDCKLQEVARYVGVTEERLRRLRQGTRTRTPDTSNPFFVRDPNRCVYCESACVPVRKSWGFRDRFHISWVRHGDQCVRRQADSRLDLRVVWGVCSQMSNGSAGAGHDAEARPQGKKRLQYCGVGCSLYLGVRGNEIVNVDGDPNGLSNHGRLCVKGRYGWDFVGHRDRLKKPLIRKDGELVEAEWDEALDLVASRFRRSGPHTGATRWRSWRRPNVQRGELCHPKVHQGRVGY